MVFRLLLLRPLLLPALGIGVLLSVRLVFAFIASTVRPVLTLSICRYRLLLRRMTFCVFLVPVLVHVSPVPERIAPFTVLRGVRLHVSHIT